MIGYLNINKVIIVVHLLIYIIISNNSPIATIIDKIKWEIWISVPDFPLCFSHNLISIIFIGIAKLTTYIIIFLDTFRWKLIYVPAFCGLIIVYVCSWLFWLRIKFNKMWKIEQIFGSVKVSIIVFCILSNKYVFF